MKQSIWIALICGVVTLCGCSAEKAPEQQQEIPAFTLSPSEKEELTAFYKELLSFEGIADKAVKLAGDEVKNVIKGGGGSITLASIIDKAKNECLLAGEALVKKSVPEALPPEMKRLLNEGKTGLAAAYAAHAESFEAIKSFVADKSPMALLEYRKKSAQAQELYSGATDKFKKIMTAAGLSQ